jgi:small subunit ribosomal protein S8e
MLSQTRSKRTSSGGRYKDYRKKKSAELGRAPALTKLGEHSLRLIRGIGGNVKHRLLHSATVNVFDKKNNKHSVAKIKTIVENPANRHFVRRSIITKGTVIDTELGKAVVKSRPGQDGVINAELLQ